MSLGLIISGVIVLLLILAVLLSASKKRQKMNTEYWAPLARLAEENGCSITSRDIWNASVIGIDEQQKFVFFIQKNADGDKKVVLNLAVVFRCKVSELSRTTGPKEGNLKVFDRIELVITHKDKAKADRSIEIYNASTDRLTLAGELQIAEKWCGIINNNSAKLNK